MTTHRSKVQEFIQQCSVPILCSIAFGFFFNQGNVFNRHYPAFQFVMSSIIASLFYYLLIFVRLRDAFIGLILLFILTLPITHSTRLAFILRDIFYITGIGLSVFIYFFHFKKHSPYNYLYPAIMLAIIYTIFYIVTLAFHLAILRTFGLANNAGTLDTIARAGAYYGGLIGFAVGLGIGINEGLDNSKKKVTA